MNIVKVSYETTMGELKPGECFRYRNRTCMKIDKEGDVIDPKVNTYEYNNLAIDFDYNKLIIITDNEKVERIKASILVE